MKQIGTQRSIIPNKNSHLGKLIDRDFESMTATDILTWSVDNFHPRLSLSCSFGNPEGLVLLDMLHSIEPSSRVYVLDTGRLPQATYDLIDRVRDKYQKKVEIILPSNRSVQEMVQTHGPNLFYESLEKRQLCCRVRKVAPNKKYLRGLDAYITGLRRSQNVTRRETPKVEVDGEKGGILKINPLADWTSDDVWAYARVHKVPTNRLHGESYPSVGCDPCTREVLEGEDPRSGRWWWENPETRECGLHVGEESEGSGI